MSQGRDSWDGDLRERLRALRVDPPERDFQASLHRRLVEAGPPVAPSPLARLRDALRERRLLWPVAGAIAGAAAALALVLARPALIGPGAVGGGPAAVADAAVVPATKVALVRVNLTAEAAVDEALIRVTLPPGLSFWADGAELPQRTFEWIQPLRAGDNEIPVAVRGQRPGRYRVAMTARVGDQRIEDEVLIEVVKG
jgi:hypothetical protein